ncbi:MAG: hypothetical protein V8T87_10410 [Victivallales bacterium]
MMLGKLLGQLPLSAERMTSFMCTAGNFDLPEAPLQCRCGWQGDSETDCSWKTAAGPILFTAGVAKLTMQDVRLMAGVCRSFTILHGRMRSSMRLLREFLWKEDMNHATNAVFPLYQCENARDGLQGLRFRAKSDRVGADSSKGSAGSTLVLYSECLAADGDIDHGSIDLYIKEGEFQTDRYTLKGAPDGEAWSPRSNSSRVPLPENIRRHG